MMTSLNNKLINRDKIFGTTLTSVEWTGMIELFKNDALDFLMFDLEHSRFSIESVENIVRLCRYVGIPTIARVPDTTYIDISRTFDMGVNGILVPRVETLEQAKAAISYAKFYPEGKKGCGGFALLKDVADTKEFNQKKIIILQIESPLGIKNLDEILSNVIVDGIIIGPTDLTITSGIPFDYYNERITQSIGKILETCLKHNISCGIYSDNKEELTYWYKRGVNLLWSGAETVFFKRGYDDMCNFIRSLG